MLCIPCYSRKLSEVPMAYCDRCGTRIKQSEAKARHGAFHCIYCFSEEERIAHIPVCPVCRQKVEEWQQSVRSPDGKIVHKPCMDGERRAALREACGLPHSRKEEQGGMLRMVIGRLSSTFG
jgi:hypothetical protein